MRFAVSTVIAVMASAVAGPAWAQAAPGVAGPAGTQTEGAGPDRPVEPTEALPVPGAKATARDVDTTSETKGTRAPAEQQPLIWRGSTLIADQSVSSETVGVGRDYQTYNPSYQWWVSLRPRVVAYEDPRQSVAFSSRLDYYKTLTNGNELPNGQDSTKLHEDVFGDTWLNATYTRRFDQGRGWLTSLGIGPRFLFPTSKVSRANGVVVTVGAGIAALQDVPLNRDSSIFRKGHVGYSSFYTHPFTGAKVAANTDTSRPRTGTDGRTFEDFQLSGGLLTEHQVLQIAEAGVEIVPKLGLTTSAIFIQKWHYTEGGGCAGGGVPVAVATGAACAGAGAGVGTPSNYELDTWLLASVDYQLLDALNLALGYYNFANQLGPDGRRQSAFFAPESARFFLTATVGLDALYEGLTGRSAKNEELTPQYAR